MAERAAVVTRIESYQDDAHVITWSGLLNTDTGSPIQMPGSADRSVQLLGTLGAGGTCRIEGSNVPSPNLAAGHADWVPLNDPSSTTLDMNSLKIEAVLENSLWIRPRVTGGDGTTNLTVQMLLKRK